MKREIDPVNYHEDMRPLTREEKQAIFWGGAFTLVVLFFAFGGALLIKYFLTCL